MSNRDSTVYEATLNAVDAGLVLLDLEGRITFWNDWIAAASGIAAGDALGRAFTAVFPSAGKRVGSAIADALSFGTSSILTNTLHGAILPLVTSSGRPMLHNVSIRPVIGIAHTCILQVSDITVAAERERILRDRQNARYDAVVLSAPDSILTLSPDGVIQSANPAATRQFGYPSGELAGMTAAQLFEEQGRWSALWRAVNTEGALNQPVELAGRRKDGSFTYLEISGSSWQAHSRIFVTVILRDVNARRAAEDALKQLNQNLEQRVTERTADRDRMWRLSTDIMLVMRTDGAITAINPAWTEYLGWSEAQLLGERLSRFIAEEDRPAWETALADLLRSQRPRLTELRLLAANGGMRIVAWNAVAGDGFVQAVGRDVTAEREAEASLRQTEDALRQSQKMEAIGQLTGGIAHDFNNLLMGITGAMAMVKRRLAKNQYDDLVRFLDAAITSANRAAALTHRLLAFSRQQSLDPQPLDVNQLIDGMIDLLRRSLGEQVRLETRLSTGIWPAMTDANQLENAVLNLAINARDAMPTGGRLTIETANVTVAKLALGKEDLAPGDYTVISVTDTGSGISPDTLAKVFDPFFTTKPLGQGTGLGLSMVYGFVRQSNGHVRIESEVNEGTTVRLYFPRYRGELHAQAPEVSPTAPRGSGERVLLVEDDSSVRLLIAEVLRELGYACVEAHDGPSALPIINSNVRLDLLVTDVGLPGLNGRQLAEIARDRRPDLKVLFVTGYAAHATVRGGFLGPGMEMITKPFNLDDLAVKIRTMIE